MTKSGTTTVLVSIIGIWLTAGSAAAPPDVSEISQGAASAMGVSGAEAEAAPWSDGDAAEDEGSVAGGRFTCCGCNPPPFGNCDCCGGFCVCEANCPGTFCNGLCPGGNFCNPGCSNECNEAICPGNVACNPRCGGNPCGPGCVCDPACPTTRCNPLCPGGSLCGPGCVNECDSFFCRDNHCNPQRCPEQARCDGTCAGGNYCNPGCSTECDHDLCYGNWLCEPVCGGYPCLLEPVS